MRWVPAPERTPDVLRLRTVTALAAALGLAFGCTGSDRASIPTTAPLSGAEPSVDTGPSAPAFATLPSVDQFTYPTAAGDVVVQIAVRVPLGPDVPLLTVYGDGTVIAATNDGWRTGRISDLDVQGLLDDAESVGLLDDALVLRSPDVPAERRGPGGTAATNSTHGDVMSAGPDITMRFAVDGRVLVHELDLARIERPPGIRVFINDATVGNRFDLTDTFEPTSWIACSHDGCDVVATRRDAASRPVLPDEDPADLLAP